MGGRAESRDGQTNGTYQCLTQTVKNIRWVEFKTLACSTLQQPTPALVMCQCYHSPPNNWLCLAAVPTTHYECVVVIYGTTECLACDEKNMLSFSRGRDNKGFQSIQWCKFPPEFSTVITQVCLLFLIS